MFGSFGWVELLFIFIIVLIIFGAGKLPQLGEGIGKTIKGFKKSVHDAAEEAVQHSAEARTTVSEIIPNNGASSEKQFLSPYVKDMIGEEDGQNLARRDRGNIIRRTSLCVANVVKAG